MAKVIDNAKTATTAQRTPLDLIHLYWERVWNNREVELIREICTDPIYRHDAESTTALSHDEQVTRVSQQSGLEPLFTHEVLLADDTHVCSVWNMVSRKDPSIKLSGIEIFRAENGRFTDCWNSTYAKGFWGRRGDPSVPHDLPPPKFLSSVEQIDHTWMQSVFAQAGVKVPRIALVTTKPIGHGNMSTTVQAAIGYNQAVENVPFTAVCKFHCVAPEAQDMVARFAPYTTEVSAYHFFGDHPPMLTPRAYLAQVSPDGMSANLVLEDLNAFCEAGDQIKGCGQKEAAAVVEQLARMHGHYWQRTDLDDLPWTTNKRRSPGDAPTIYASGVAIFLERYSAGLSADEIATIKGFAPLVGDWMAIKPEMTTLIHSDPRVDNIMFDRRDAARICAYVLDWQCVDVGDAQYDVAYFLSGSLTPADRRACERKLIADHAAAIARVDPAYTAEKALKAYRRNVVSGLYATVSAVNVMPDTPHNKDLLMTLVRRNCATVRDWEGLQALA